MLTLLPPALHNLDPFPLCKGWRGIWSNSLDFWHMGLDFSLCPHGLSWGDPGTVGCWTPASPTQLLHEVCKRRGIVQTFKIILKRTPAGCSHAVGSVLQHPCSICVFPYTGAGCQAAWDESWGALFLYPCTPGFSQTGTFLPCSHTGTFTKKRKSAQSP